MAEAHKGNLPNDPAFKCFLHCMFEMFGLVRSLQSIILVIFTKCNLSLQIDSEHVMHMEALLEVLPEELHPKIKNLIEACGTKSEYCEITLSI